MNSAEIIETCRGRAGMARAQLADKLGVNRSAIYGWERYGISPSTDTFIALCDAMGFEIIVKPKYEVYKKAKYHK
jgi:ribosome-binding protein aMBF1 (putative translation factor)